jgi:RNA polymerase sigma-70 factor (ECF subfamily)
MTATLPLPLLDAAPSTDGAAIGARLRAGDAAALEILLAELWEPVVRFVLPLVDGQDAAEDVAQRAFLRVWDERLALRADGAVRAVLYRAARNLALNERRDRRTRLRLLDARAREGERAGAGAPARSPLELLEAAELRRAAAAAIAALPERRREVFVLARYHGMSYGEIAEILELSPQTVANTMSAALAALRRELGGVLG